MNFDDECDGPVAFVNRKHSITQSSCHLSEAKDLCTTCQLHRSFAANNVGLPVLLSTGERSIETRSYILTRSPKMAEPTRTQVEPSSIAISKSCDMPMESTFMLIAGSLRAAMVSRSSRSLRK